MGWCSGTEIFDEMAGYVIGLDELPEYKQIYMLKKLIRILQDQDWDCESDSEYWTHPTVRAAFKVACPDWDWEDIEEGEED